MESFAIVILAFSTSLARFFTLYPPMRKRKALRVGHPEPPRSSVAEGSGVGW